MVPVNERGNMEGFLQWLEDGLRSVPIFTRIILITFLACSLGLLAMNSGYLLAGGQ
jgi:hypothetical protein